MIGASDGPAHPVTGRVAGAQTGAVLAFVSSGILGQYDPFAQNDPAVGPAGGCLLLVYPNVIAVERQLRLAPSDFRLWVCLHEVTHRVQFTANPWLSQYMSQSLGVLTADRDDDFGQVAARLSQFLKDRRTVDPAPTTPGSSGSCAPQCPSRNAKRSTGCWCSALCWKVMPIT